LILTDKGDEYLYRTKLYSDYWFLVHSANFQISTYG
jgi:hypothetical protein